MLFSEVLDHVLVETGQFYFLTSTPDPLGCLGLSLYQLWHTIGTRQLKRYERWRPLTAKFTRTLQGVGTLGQAYCLFGEESGGSFGEGDANDVWTPHVGALNRDPGLVPRTIVDCQPTTVLNVTGIISLLQISAFINVGEVPTVYQPRPYLWRYERDDAAGILYATEVGRVQVTALYDFPTEEIIDSDNTVVDVDILYLNEHTDWLYVSLVQAIFMQVIGRSRRGFQLNGSTIQLDGPELVQEGKELEQQTVTELQESGYWWQAIGT